MYHVLILAALDECNCSVKVLLDPLFHRLHLSDHLLLWSGRLTGHSGYLQLPKGRVVFRGAKPQDIVELLRGELR